MKTLVWLIGACLLFSLPAQAASPFRPAEVSDAELSELRGRYVMPGRIVHFGVTMSSVWANSAGQTVGASVTFQLDSKAQPSLYVTDLSGQSDPEVASPPPGTGQVVGGAGLRDVQGISQSVRSAGDFNDGLNNLEIVISREGGQLEPDNGAVPWTGSGTFTNEAGRVLVAQQGGGLKILVDAGSQGAALQQIGAGNVIQQANFSGDFNTVRNMATLNVGLRDLPLGFDFANCTLEQLRALRPMGF